MTRFAHPWHDLDDYKRAHPAILVPELMMMAASNAIREKHEWWRKIQDPEIVQDWRDDLGYDLQSYTRKHGSWGLRQEQLDYVFAELEWYASLRQQQIDSGVLAPIERAIDGTRRSDGLIPQQLKEMFLACVDNLQRHVQDDQKDWHPGSGRQVLDIIHPSLFCFVAGRTRVTKEEAVPPLDFIGQGDIVDETPKSQGVPLEHQSQKFQWLPTDFEVSMDGKVTIKSYINNLHPVEHKAMYPILGEIFEQFLPMFEQVLGDLQALETRKPRLICDTKKWFKRHPHYPDYNSVPTFPKIPNFEPIEPPPVYSLRGRTLQVIVKVASIELTPENPRYNGGTWHVEGMANENIVATGIYYYRSDNITASRLDFRIHVREFYHVQGAYLGTKFMYGIHDGEPMVQHLDGIETKEDRCIAFPNVYQHQVQPFELDDETKPGSRGILVFFLVDPERPVLSTTHVPPQQKGWGPPHGLMKDVEERMPAEIVQMIDRYVDWPMEIKEAKEHRDELMKERKFFVKETNEDLFERPFSLCEH